MTIPSEYKKFALRDLTPALHTRWKVASTLAGVSMQEFAHIALRLAIEHVERENGIGKKEEEREKEGKKDGMA